MTGSPRLYLVRPPSFPTLRSPDLHGERRHGGPAHAHAHPHEHEHVHAHRHADCGCGHAHAPAADLVAGPLEWRKAVSAILAMGLRPCSGALIVLVRSEEHTSELQSLMRTTYAVFVLKKTKI